jgi:archaellum component FlaC
MSTTPIQISTDLSKILERIDQRLERMEQDITVLKIGQTRLEEKLEIGQARLEEKVESLKTEIGNVKEDIKEIKGSQKAQIWTLIGILGSAVVATVIRFVITTLPSNP